MSAKRRAGQSRCVLAVIALVSIAAAIPIGDAIGANEEAPSPVAAPRPSFDLKDPARIKAGKRRFTANCAGYCHGSDGSAGRGPSFLDRPDFNQQLAFVTIRDGRKGSDVMPPWGSAFNSDEIWELVAFLSTLAERKE
ncbi:MAG: c-type cytochrome [Acetobacteraceae bacterium]|nr:c-type cytochrome [Acetobacteraceae bacterium]MBV8589277.1 c-type cytochrome [Acetobacteraceae bacterium]